VVVGTNADLFPQALQLYTRRGAKVADTTYGRGVFWQNIPTDWYELWPTDLETGVDARALPYGDGEFDALVFDPPYMHGSAGAGPYSDSTHNMDRYYRNSSSGPRGRGSAGAYHQAVVDLYLDAAREAFRVLRPEGVYYVKCQDEVSANRQRLTHVELVNELGQLGFRCEDLFVLVQSKTPPPSPTQHRQVHARKAHSYLLVFVKGAGIWRGP
jgi:tRNA G10  N-methylase Trm11